MTQQKQFKHFGVLLSTSKTLYTVETLKTFMDYMVKMGYDMLYIDISGGYEIEDEPFFCYLRARYSKSEMKDIDSYAVSKGITLIPTIQTLAHLEHLFKWKKYNDICDIDGIMLAGDPRVYALVDKMLYTMKECFSSGRIHLGMDEAFRLGRGKYCDLNGPVDRSEIMQKHVQKVLEIVDKYGLQAEMWGDMYIRLAYGAYDVGPFTCDKSEKVRKIVPKNVKLHYWDYYSQEKDRYHYFIDHFEKITDKIVFDGGVWNYIGFNPDNTYSIKATESALAVCLERNIEEATITLWGGDGTECSLWAGMPTLVAAAEYAKGNTDKEGIKKRFKEIMGMDFDSFIDLEYADKLRPYDENNTDRTLLNPTKYLLYNDLFNGFFDTTIDESERERFFIAAKKLEEATKNRKWGYIFKMSKALAEVMEIKFGLGIRTRRAYKQKDKESLKRLALEEYTELLKRLKKFYESFKAMWFKENKAQGFDIHDIRLGGLMQRVLHCKNMLLDYCNGKIDKVEELEVELVDWHDGGTEYHKGAFYDNGYIVSVSVNTL